LLSYSVNSTSKELNRVDDYLLCFDLIFPLKNYGVIKEIHSITK